MQSETLSIKEAIREAVDNGKRIRHINNRPEAYMYYVEGNWYMNDGYECPNEWWKGSGPQWQTGWSVLPDE